MTLAAEQLSQLRNANPFIGDDLEWQYLGYLITQQTGLSSDQIFEKTLEYAEISLGVLQYLLETPSEVLNKLAIRLSNQVRPNAGTITLLQDAVDVINVCNVSILNPGLGDSGDNDIATLYHVPEGQEPGEVNICLVRIIYLLPPYNRLPFQIQLQPGDKIYCKSVGGRLNFQSYLYV